MQTEGEAVHRTLTCWRERVHGDETQLQPFPETELKRIAQAYDQPAPSAEARKYSFQGEFVGQPPDDIGGSGMYTDWTTRMGSVALYVERFRGDDDLAAAIAARQEAADKFTDLMIGWFRAETGEDPSFGNLQDFMEKDFRRHLKNVAVYRWTAQAAEVSSRAERPGKTKREDREFAVRILQYLMERGYLTPQVLPDLVRAFEQQDGGRLLKLVRGVAAEKMEIRDAQAATERLEFLSSPDRAVKSLDAYLAGTEAYQAFLAEWRQKHIDKPNATPPGPIDFLGRVFAEVIGFAGGQTDRLDVSLASPVRPYSTNGTWNAAAKQVHWSAKINAVGEKAFPVLPSVLYAFWSVPDKDFQRRHFGKVVLSGRPLGEYSLWRKGLTESEGEEWDRFVSSLAPDDALAERLKEFRFTTDPAPSKADDEQPKSLADPARKLITTGLENEKK